ncbi:MAG: nuclease/helicase [Porticoccaceae bacterium]|nr:MAG: nuclease/helicase [Porticoccaceae bacterium]
MTPPDAAERDRALDITSSFAVSAPAGSGKTSLLVRRFLRLLATCEQPEQLLAITFTRKAAGEMRERVLAALDAAQGPAPSEAHERAQWEDARRVLERDRALGWRLLAAPSRLRILTIDGLCRQLARLGGADTGLGDLPEPSEAPALLYREAAASLLDRLEVDDALREPLAVLLEQLDCDRDALERLLAELLAQRDQWLPLLLSEHNARSQLEATLRGLVSENLAAAASALAPWRHSLPPLAAYAAGNLAADSPFAVLRDLDDLPPAEPEALDQWRALARLLTTQQEEWRSPKGVNASLGFPAPSSAPDPRLAERRREEMRALLAELRERPEVLERLADLQHLPPTTYEERQWRVLEALTRVLPLAAAELSVLFRRRGTCDFVEVALAALTALGEGEAASDLALRLDAQVRHILVDEFQDTSSLQYELLARLTRDWTSGDGRTLFLVGDAMQSLYGFRNANVGLFLKARQHPLGAVKLEPLDLTANFRADPLLVAWTNAVFTRVFPAADRIDRGAVRYLHAAATRPGARGTRITVESLPPDADPQTEAWRVAELVREARACDPEGSIAVLVRARGHLGAVPATLDRLGIPWRAEDVDPLASRMPVLDLHSLTCALIDPADRMAWLALLRAPWCGLTLPDLYLLTGAETATPPPPVWARLFDPAVRAQLSADGRRRADRVAAILEAAWKRRGRVPLRRLVEGTWLALGGPAALLDTAEARWCQGYLDLLESHADGPRLRDRQAFESALAALYAPAASDRPDAVQLMTVHKAKGLEFDTVILLGLDRAPPSPERRLLHWQERIDAAGRPSLLLSPLSPAAEAEADRLVDYLKREAKARTRLEDQRVLYVACTRARRRLHLLYRAPAKDRPREGSLLALLWPALDASRAAGAEHLEHNLPPAAAPPVKRLAHLARFSTAWRNPVAELRREPPAVPPPPASGGEGNGSEAADTQLAALGTVLHRTLRRIAEEGPEAWNRARIARQRRAWEVELAALGAIEVEALAERLAEAVRRTLADPRGRWLLDPGHAEGACELALAHREGERVQLSVVDRTFVADGVRWVVDYKSTLPAPGEDPAAFAAREAARHLPQLARYRAILTRRDPSLPVRTALYFPLLPLWWPVEAP